MNRVHAQGLQELACDFVLSLQPTCSFLFTAIQGFNMIFDSI
jgi:hypothetical protein